MNNSYSGEDRSVLARDLSDFLSGYYGLPTEVFFTVLNSRNMESWLTKLDDDTVDYFRIDNLHQILKSSGGQLCLMLSFDAYKSNQRLYADELSSGIEAFLERCGVSRSTYLDWNASANIVVGNNKTRRGVAQTNFEAFFPAFNEDFCTEVLGIVFPEDIDDSNY